MKDYSQFVKDNGPVSFGPVKIPGIYILHIPYTNDRYVGQSINLGLRIRSHLHMTSKSTKFVLQSLKVTKEGSVTTCIVSEDILNILTTSHHINIENFLDILEQYVILLVKPTLNKLSLVRHGGVTSSYSNRILKHPHRLPLYVYKIVSRSPLEKVLIYEFPTIGSLGKLLDMNPDFGRSILKSGGFFRDTVYLTTIPPTEIDKQEVLSETEFVKFFIEIINKSYRSAAKPVYLINAITKEKTGPYPSVTYVCNNVVIGASRKYIRVNRQTPYRGFFMKYVNETD